MRIAYKFLRYAVYILEVYFLYSLQQTPNFSFSIFGVRPLCLIAGFVSIIFYENRFVSLGFGIWIGLLIDLAMGNILGCHALILGFLGYLINIVFERFIRANLMSAIFISVFLAFIVTFINSFMCQALYGSVNTSSILIHNYIPIVIYTAIITLPIYLFNRTVFYLTGEFKNEIFKR